MLRLVSKLTQLLHASILKVALAASQRECGSLTSQLEHKNIDILNLNNVNGRLSARIEKLQATIANLESDNGHLVNRLAAFDL